MVKEHLQAEVIRQLDLYEELLSKQDFKRAGDVYSHYMYVLSKRLTQDEEIFKQIADELLFLHDKPYIQTEVATEAIGLNYRTVEAIELLEKIGTWAPDMTLQSARGKYCNTAQMRLHHLLGYPLDTISQSWERPDKIEITEIFQKYFSDRAKSGVDVKEKRVGFTAHNEQTQLNEITAIFSNDTDDFLFFCRTITNDERYILISKEGEFLAAYPSFKRMEPFKRNTSIVLTEESFEGVLMKNGDFCIPPLYHEIFRINATFFMALHEVSIGDLYHHTGRMILKDIAPFDLQTNDSSTFIYQNALYDEYGQIIASLTSVGTDWEASRDLGEYIGLNAASEVVFIDNSGKKLNVTLDFETQLLLDQAGDVVITTEHEKTYLTMDGKAFSLDGEALVLVKRFSNEQFIVRGEWSEGQYLWIDRKKKKLQFFEEIICPDADYFFAKKRGATFWIVIDHLGKTCVNEKKEIIHITKEKQQEHWSLEDIKLQHYFLLPASKKLVLQEKLMKQFIRKNRLT